MIPKYHTLQIIGTILFKHFTKLAVQSHETEVNDNNLNVPITVVLWYGDVNNPRHVPNMVIYCTFRTQ